MIVTTAPRGPALEGEAGAPPVEPVRLAVSAQAATVFTSLLDRCVPALCDRVVIELAEGEARRTLAAPAEDMSLPVAAGERVVRLEIAEPPDTLEHPVGAVPPRVEGGATFVWTDRVPSAADRLLVAALTEQAVRTVVWRRSHDRASVAAAKAENLQIALANSRYIGMAMGVLMSRHRLTDDRAFELLRTASQFTHRKLRDIAATVVDTGWLDPALLGPHAPQLAARLASFGAADTPGGGSPEPG